MRFVKTLAVATALFLLCCGSATTALSKDLIVVASKATYEAAHEWVGFLTIQEVPLKHVTPQDFKAHEKEPYVVVMGGLDELDGIKEIARELLSEEEFKHVSQNGMGETYFKFKVWDPMQTVIMFVGSDMAAAEKARIKSKENWWNTFILWFDLEAEMEGFHVY
jgi:glycine betaine/choline ABC-type transport system substrate-binding protein